MISFQKKQGGLGLPNYKFTIRGKIYSETKDDAMDIIRLTLEDIGVRVDKILLDGDGVSEESRSK